MRTILTIAAIALLTLTACTRTQERCHTATEMLKTNPAQRLGYAEHKAVQVSEIGCNRFAVIVEDADGQRCGYIMDYQP